MPKEPYVEFNLNASWPPPKNLQHGGRWSHANEEFDTIRNKVSEFHLDLETASPVLDFGCGTGRLMQFWNSDQEVWGIDVNHNMIKWCRENLDNSLNFLCPSAPHLPFEDNYFKFIFGWSVFTHISYNYLLWLLELRRILCPTGLLLITVLDDYVLYKQNIDFPYVRNNKDVINNITNGNRDFLIASVNNLTFFRKDNLEKELSKYFNILDYCEPFYTFQSAFILSKYTPVKQGYC